MTQRNNWAAISTFSTLVALIALNQPSLAMDCKKATLPIEKAICADPAASAADQALDTAYAALSASKAEADKKQLLRSQRSWLKSRANFCTEDNKPAIKCLVAWTERRAAYLRGKPESGPGTGHDVSPIIIAQSETAKLYEQDISVVKFAAPALPGEKLFNEEIDKLLKEAPSAKEADDQPDMTYSYDLNVRLSYASPRFLSASVQTYVFSGGAHGNSGTSGINIDVVTGKPISFAEVFLADAKAKLTELCFTQVKARKEENGMGLDDGLYTVAQLRDTIRDDLGKLDRWTFSTTQGLVTFDPYELGAYAEGSFECTFPTETLHSLYKPGSILP